MRFIKTIACTLVSDPFGTGIWEGVPLRDVVWLAQPLNVRRLYFYGFHKDRPHDPRSATKSLATALVGVVIDGGAQLDAETPVYSLFPEYAGYAHDDARKREIRARDKAMRTGFAE